MDIFQRIANHLFNPNMTNVSPALIFGVGIGISVIALMLMFYKYFSNKKSRFSANVQAMRFVEMSKDQITRWIETTESRMGKTNLKIKGKGFVVVNIILAVLAFLIGQYLFRNLIVSILFSGVLFVIPEYLISVLEDHQEKKIEDQLSSTIKIYSAEFVQGKPLQKIFFTISKRIGNPVGQHFSDAHFDLITGTTMEEALSRLSNKFDSHHGKMFIQLIHQSQKNANIIELFPDLTNKIEEHIELSRNNESNIASERLQAFLLALLPIPAYIFMANAFPETQQFVRETYYGRLIITLSFVSLFVFVFLDRFIRRVE